MPDDVMAVLSQAGCNMGACHGNQQGKGGFRLSLRGQDAAFDYESIVKQHGGRRINRIEPHMSLLLRKPSMQLAHEGGRRLPADQRGFAIVRQWLASGAPPRDPASPAVTHLTVTPRRQVRVMPEHHVQIHVVATRDDGSEVDVSDLAVYEPSSNLVEVATSGLVTARGVGEVTVIVRYLNHQLPVTLAFVPPPAQAANVPLANNLIDTHINQKLAELGLAAADECDDATFLRRVYLDVLGILPTADEAQSFLADQAIDKRQQCIERLLARPEFADHWALKWSDLLRIEEKVLDARGVDTFYDWIHAAIRRGKPLDQFAHELITSRGSTYEVPQANYYRANRDPITRAETTARLMLGIRLQCAQCHNHPFDRWTQDDYYGWASCFAGIDYEILQNKRTDEFDKNEFVGDQIVTVEVAGHVTNPRSGQPAVPRVLGGAAIDPAASDRFEQLADWITGPDNPWFARVMANWVYYHLMGRGLVEPIDDFRATNPPSHPELLDALARELIDSGYDLRHLVRLITTSAAYQRSALMHASAGDVAAGATDELRALEEANFARAIVRRLTAEQLLDAQTSVLGVPVQFAGYEPGTRAGQLRGVSRTRGRRGRQQEGDRLLAVFGKPQRLLACECERSNETTLGQALLLIGGQGLHERLAAPDNRLHAWSQSNEPLDVTVEQLYWTALGRPPTSDERQAAETLLGESQDPFEAWQDLVWALMNSKEFLFRH